MEERIDPIDRLGGFGSQRSGHPLWHSVTNKSEDQKPAVGARALSPERLVSIFNRELRRRGTFLRFKLFKDSGQLQVQVIDVETGDVVRKLPPDYLYRIRKSIKTGVSMVIDDQAD